MIEKEVIRKGKKVIEVRSDGGKLLYVKTSEGYEIKCPRTKQICVIRYEDMLSDCLKCLEEADPTHPLLQKFLVSA
jgi:phage FluMu protein Com